MKIFRVKDHVEKVEGYQFIGVVDMISPDGESIVVKIDCQEALALVCEVATKYKMTEKESSQLLRFVNNGNGMKHIFNKKQLIHS